MCHEHSSTTHGASTKPDGVCTNDKVEVKMLEHIYNNGCRLEQKRVVN